MKFIKIVLTAVLVLVAAGVIFYAYFGGFRQVDISISESGGEVLVYEKMLGDYRQSAEVMDRVYYTLLNEDKIETFKGFGIYYDNPQEVEHSVLRSDVGCILEETDISKIPQLQEKYSVRTFPVKEYIIAEFPYKGKASVFVGIMKVYPQINAFAEENGYSEDGAVMEIYDMPNKKILYRKELTKNTSETTQSMN